MPTTKTPRKGSLQFWPRKRASKFLPRVNWKAIDSEKKLMGFIAYKAGMVSVEVKDLTANSLTKDKKIIIPATVLECPSMKILSVRFYKYGKVAKDILAEHLDKELKRKVKLPKQGKAKFDSLNYNDYDDVSIIAYSLVKKTGIKTTPDLSEIGVSGSSVEEKINFIKEHLNKEISVSDAFNSGDLADTRGLTKGKGLVGPLKRFGLKLKKYKSEKGQRRPGNIGPWHPARVTFRIPMAGQLGMFTRVNYNGKIISVQKSNENPISNLKNYGDVKTDYIIMAGSVQGPSKRQILITAPLRKSKMSAKKKYEFIGVLR